MSAERERQSPNFGVKEFDLKSAVLYLTLLTDELIETRFSNLAGAVRGGIRSTIVAGRGAVQFHLKANGLTVLRRT